jgi:hypothetical protein
MHAWTQEEKTASDKERVTEVAARFDPEVGAQVGAPMGAPLGAPMSAPEGTPQHEGLKSLYFKGKSCFVYYEH